MKNLFLLLFIATMVVVTVHTSVQANPIADERLQQDVIISSPSAGPQDLELTSLYITPFEPRSGDQFTISFALHNPTDQDIMIGQTGIGLRGPDACAPENPWTSNMPRPQPEEWRDHVVLAGETRWFIRDYATHLEPGHYIIEPVYYCAGCSNTFPPFNHSSPLWFDVLHTDYSRQIPNCLIVSEPLTIDPPNPSAGQDVNASFTLRNNSSRTIVLERVLAAGRYGDNWAAPNADFPDAPNQPVFLQPGAEFQYDAARTFSEEGSYFAEPWRKEAGVSGKYYTGGIWGGNRAFLSVNTNCFDQYRAEYFSNSDLAGEPVFTQCENWPIDHNWGYDGPGHGVSSDTFSVRWTGRATLEETFYDFYYGSDDAMRAWLYWVGSPTENPNLFDNWTNPVFGDQIYSRTIRPTTEYEIIVEYANRGGFAEAKFRWEARPRIGQIQGRVTDENGVGIAGVRVSTASTSRHNRETGPDGSFSFSSLPIESQYDVYVSKEGYVFDPSQKSVFLPSSDAVELNFTGTPSNPSSGSIVGQVLDQDGAALTDVRITAKALDNTEYQALTEGFDAIYTIDSLPPSTYTITPAKEGYTFEPTSQQVIVPSFEALVTSFRANRTSAQKVWTILFYLAGDNNLDKSLQAMLESITRVQGNRAFNVAILFDGGTTGDTKYYVVTDTVITYTPSDIVSGNPTELNSSNPVVLTNFINWAMEKLPSTYTALVIADHGGLSGIATDTASGGAYISTKALGEALKEVVQSQGRKIDVLFTHACLMATVEVGWQIKDTVDYYVASEQLIWIVNVTNFLSSIQPNTSPRDLAVSIADNYVGIMRNIKDRNNRPYPFTISVANISQVPEFVDALDELSSGLRDYISTNSAAVMRDIIMADVQYFDSTGNFPIEPRHDELIDVYHFAQLVKQHITDSADIQNHAQDVMDAIKDGSDPYIIYAEKVSGTFEYNGPEYTWNHDGSYGVSVFFARANSRRSYYSGENLDFAAGTSWDQALLHSADMDQDVIAWGSMMATYVNAVYPNAPDDATPPILASPLVAPQQLNLPLMLRAMQTAICNELVTKQKIWQGDLDVSCDESTKRADSASLKLHSATPSIAELYSPLLRVEPNTVYRVSYWIKTDIEIDGADIYGRIIAAEYNSQALESDEIDQNRIALGFNLGESVGGQTDWVARSYTFRTGENTRYVRLRAVMGGPVGTAQGTAWFDEISLDPD